MYRAIVFIYLNLNTSVWYFRFVTIPQNVY